MRSFATWLTRGEALLVVDRGDRDRRHDAADQFRRLQPLPAQPAVFGAYEITEKYLMTAAIFLGLSYAYRGGAFIRVTFLVDRLPPSARLVANMFAHLVSLALASCSWARPRSRRCARCPTPPR